jgi:hypothetical protein
MQDEDDPLWLEILRYLSALLPMHDAFPSSAISSAVWDPAMMEVTIHFKNGRHLDYPCTPDQWFSYKTSSSRGSAFNEIFRG